MPFIELLMLAQIHRIASHLETTLAGEECPSWIKPSIYWLKPKTMHTGQQSGGYSTVGRHTACVTYEHTLDPSIYFGKQPLER